MAPPKKIPKAEPSQRGTGTFYDPENKLAGHEPSHNASPLSAHDTGADTAANANVDRIPGAGGVSETAIPVEEGLSADHTLSPQEDTGDQPQATPLNERQQLIADVERIRGLRRPFGAFTQKLALPQRPGYHRHWFNDVAGRIDEALGSGWAHVKGQDGKPIKRPVGTGRDNGVMYAMAMEIPEVFWQEDMAARHEAAASRMEELKAKPFQSPAGQAKASDKGKFYDPHEDTGQGPISIRKG